ncbi:hypothetical protein BD324DRAFT_652694 [Kockovaella imperatae]|uniref:Uncharacterized protein n=1 Tax=Kockovaella imperatae TaxID=4999 RepID=A0A1Y1UAD5_9TREE|nr:hypothetical protein BD324DRAFT_652694 [Kockovaella imperatae]ORX34972.1 hypothetical protein BD324DRAFT_652694 [Kockovaella imperatae]
MQQEKDVEGSEKARQDGNTSFKKGKWSEAIGHYTNAILKNPTDPVGYTNRAAAYLKLDKYEDANRDCTSAIEIQPENLKALYRRSLALKSLGRLDEALRDISLVCKLDRGNAVAKEERKEIRELVEALEKKSQQFKPPQKTPPISPESRPIAASIEEIVEETSQPTVPSHESSQTTPIQSIPKPSFSDLKRSRAAKPAFTTAKLPAHTPDASKPPITTPLHHDILPIASSPAPRLFVPPADPHSTSPGSGLTLLRHLSPPQLGWTAIQHYPAQNVPIILGPLLEPDTLAQLFSALKHGLDGSSDSAVALDEARARILIVMKGLLDLPRWRVNASMLSRSERELGRQVWAQAGGQGQWP